MTVSLIEVTQGTDNSSQTNVTVALTATPAAGDVVVVAWKTLRTAGARTVLSVSGLGATWAAGYTPGGRIAFWVGTGATASGTVTVVQSGLGAGLATVYLVRGLTSPTVAGVTASATSTTLTGANITAATGQFAISATTALAGTITFPSAQAPAASWTGLSNISILSTSACDAYVVAGASATHRTDVSTTTSAALQIATITIGSVVAGGDLGTGATGSDVALAAILSATIGVTAAAGSDVALTASLTATLGLSAVVGSDVALSADLTVTPPSAVDLTGATADDVALAADLTLASHLALGAAATSDDVALSADLTVTVLGTLDLGTASTSSDVDLAATLNLDLIHLLPWTADTSQKTLLEIVLTDTELMVTPPVEAVTGPDYLPPVGALALPPTGLVERTIMRESITVPAMTPGTDHRVHVNDAVYDAYARTIATVGVPHVLIGGVDVTYLRGTPITIGSDRQEGPFGDVTFSIDMPQITPQDTPGAGSLSWLKPGATVELVMLNGGAIKRLWAGHLVSDDGGNDATSPRTAWSASGTMWQASTFGHRVPTIMDPTDIGTVIAKALNGVVAHRYPSLSAPHTGINTMARGSSGDSEMAYVQSLLATAWTSTTQWTVAKRANTARTYDIKLKDTTTVHHTVTVGARGVDVDLSRDLTSTANCLFGRGIAPNGYAWAGWCYPNFMADTAPAYPYASGATVMSVGDTDAGTLTGHGVTDWQRRVNDLNLTGNVPLDGVYNTSDASICRQIQADYGLLVDGIVGPQTWDATFAVGSSGGDLTGAYRRPLAIATETEPNLYTPTGAVKGPNPGYTSAMRYERDTDYGPGVTKADATASAKLELARDKTPGLTGTITLLTDPREGSRFYITPGQNIRILGYGGAGPLLHIAAVDRDWANLSVTLTVDEHARDAITLAAIRQRNKEAMLDPARRPGRTNRRSRQDQDQIVSFDGESDGGIIPRHAIYGGLWTVIRIPLSEAGTAAILDVRSQSPAAKFCMVFFAGPVTPAHLVSLVGDPLAGDNPFGRTEAKADALDDLGLIEAFGGPGSASGYWPQQEGSGPLTGRLKDKGGFTYNSVKGGWVWVAEWSPTSTFISGRVYPAPIQ